MTYICLTSWRLLNIILGIVGQSDTKIDLVKYFWVSDLYFVVQWFCLISWRSVFTVCCFDTLNNGAGWALALVSKTCNKSFQKRTPGVQPCPTISASDTGTSWLHSYHTAEESLAYKSYYNYTQTGHKVKLLNPFLWSTSFKLHVIGSLCFKISS